MSDSTSSAPGQNARPALGTDNIYDVDAAQHFLADHVASIIVAFDHDAMDPAVNIYTATSEGALSPGDYYLMAPAAPDVGTTAAGNRRKSPACSGLQLEDGRATAAAADDADPHPQGHHPCPVPLGPDRQQT